MIRQACQVALGCLRCADIVVDSGLVYNVSGFDIRNNLSFDPMPGQVDNLPFHDNFI